MNDAKAALDDLLARTTTQSNWQPPLEPALDGIGAKQAAWRPAEGRNSIHMIVRHLIVWKGAVLADMRGEAPNLPPRSPAGWGPLEADDEAWESDRADLERLNREVQEATAAPDLGLPLAAFGTPLGATLMHVAAHDAYHTGQIVYLRRLQGT